MKEPNRDEANGYVIAAILLVVILGLLAALGSLGVKVAFAPGEVRYRCDDFTSYAGAKQAYDDGATYLDGGGIPGIPCETLYNKKK